MTKEITVREFAAELIDRIEKAKNIDCCKEEIKRFAELAANRMGDEKISVTWKDA